MTLAPSPSRRIRQLRMHAASRESIPRLATLVEDALRTATLPESGPRRLILIRRLDLGRIDPRASATAIALGLELAVRRGTMTLLPATDPAAAGAEGVWFRDEEQAIAMLAGRLVEGRPADEWFWPLLIPGWRAERSLAHDWRCVLKFARRQLAPGLALAAVVRELLAGGALLSVLHVISELEARAWLMEAGFPESQEGQEYLGRPADLRGISIDHPRLIAFVTSAPARAPGFRERLVWLVTMAILDRHPAQSVEGNLPGRVRRWIERTQVSGGRIPVTAAPMTPLKPPAELWVAVPARGAGAESDLDEVGSPGARLPADVWPPASLGPQRSIHSAPTQGAQEASSVGVSTCAGGLLFLLPVLRDLGLPAFIASRPALAEGGFGLTVLREFARRARVPSDDPIWEMLALTNACIEAEPTFPEEVLPLSLQTWLWDEPPFRRRKTRSARESPWVTAARRWCRRRLHMGLYTLIRRPARIDLSRTRVDLSFTFDQIDLSIRRAGLDLDPGWVPWLGRIIQFHYRSPSPHEA